jgi:hypothetical protein
MKLKRAVLYTCVIVLGLSHSMASAEVHVRNVRFVIDANDLTMMQSGSLDIVELATGFSETFKPAQLTGVDMLNIHVEFFDPQGNQIYVVLRDLGGEYLNPRGWQWFQAAVGLDTGTVTGTYVNGWTFTDALPEKPGNYACCTRTANAQSVIQSTGYGLRVTDSSIAIKSMRIQFNFNHYSNPVVITDGGGFNRLSLKFRSESIALVRIPYTTPVYGPWGDDGVAFDVDGDGKIDTGSGDQKIGVGLGIAQHFRYEVAVSPGMPSPADFSYALFLPDGFVFDPSGEENFNGCKDGLCDGISDLPGHSCAVTISGPTMRKNQVVPRNAAIEPSDPFVGALCRYNIFIVTQGQKQGRNYVFAPTECQKAATSDIPTIASWVKITNGVQFYDNIAETLFPENVGRQLEPVGCP